MPTTSLPKGRRLRFAPKNNPNSDDRHCDLSAYDGQELAVAILDGIHSRTIRWTCLGNEDGSYRLQAAAAYSHCLVSTAAIDGPVGAS